MTDQAIKAFYKTEEWTQWQALMAEAKAVGLTVAEVRAFISDNRRKGVEEDGEECGE